MEATMRPGSSTQASCSYTMQSRSMQIGNWQCRSAMPPTACRSGNRQRAAVHVCSSSGRTFCPGLRLVETLQKAGQHCTRLNTARASSAGGALDVACSAQPEYTGTIQHVVSMPFGDLAEGLETPVQLIYLLTLLGFLVVGAYLVVRQVLVRRELEEAAKVLGERIRTNDASPEDCFELGVILLRKKLYTQATKNLEKASRMWDGEPEELAQVHNALGFAYFNMERSELALKNYKRAVELQPGYTTAWNNLGDAYEKARDWDQAMKAYEETLAYSPDNKVARNRVDSLRNKVSMAR